MNWKWLETSTCYDGEPSGGGEPAAVVNTTESDGGPAPAAEPAAAEPAAAEPTAVDADPGPVAFPDKLKNVFIPQSQHQGSPQAPPVPTQPQAPRQPQAAPEKPSAELWQMEPDKAAAMQEAYLEHKINEGVRRASEPVNEIRRGLDQDRQSKFQEAASKASLALPTHYEKVLNRDRDFRSNPKLQELTERVIGEFVAGALNQGSMEDLQFIQEPRFARRALAIAKADLEDMEAYSLRATGGPTPIGPQGMKQREGALIDDEVAKGLPEASKWAGREYTPEAIAAAQKKIDDSDW